MDMRLVLILKVPLCGTQGVPGTCHDYFDKYEIALLYNPSTRTFYFLNGEGIVSQSELTFRKNFFHINDCWHGEPNDSLPRTL
jgi:hypothetical protein